MELTEKYQPLIDIANQNGVGNLQVAEQEGVLYITGTTNNGDVKQKMWDKYGEIDPDYRAGDLVLNIEVEGGGYEEYTVQPGDSLSKIGKHWGKNWKEIWDLNRDVVGPNYNLIHPGQKLKIPR
ncbi:MAG TPA: LysM peptidoglycan-binding domain-containing protein [Pyrinomonadaceae bacterium]|nr:LysM peptidoglycan-binding domain-containing protein [Pyrinomonadaceae bacterium]